ncbi:hypothetical protein [Arthrobacter sp. ERGS1:01]|uniref:hypothetical protein n=1 Tax=Arthrobacter sp. ERGS1:01 TaxID=1704044 RepID=UPI000AEB0FDE|nr:hypothetical protein [Arthrobacter sp. ERGS1:01]
MDDTQYPIRRVPRDESARRELLATMPPVWEYLLFGGALVTGLERTEPKWRDYHLGLKTHVGPTIAKSDLAREVSVRMAGGSTIVSNLDKLLSPKAQALAFGPPGVSGDPALIEHIGIRLVEMYEKLLDWVIEFRSIQAPDNTEKLLEIGCSFLDQPIQETRNSIQKFVSDLENAIDSLDSDAEQPRVLSLEITFKLDSEITDSFLRELERVVR